MRTSTRLLLVCTPAFLAAADLTGQETRSGTQRVATADLAPPLTSLVSNSESELRTIVTRYSADRAALLRRYDTDFGSERRARLREFERAWQSRLNEIDFNRLGPEGRIDHVLLTKRLTYELKLLDREDEQVAEMKRFAPFLERLTGLPEERRRLGPPDAAALARSLAQVATVIDSTRTRIDSAWRTPPKGDTVALRKNRVIAYRTANALDNLRRNALARWYGYFAGYDPTFTWWVKDPYSRVDTALTRYVRTLRERVVGYRQGEDEPIIGDPIGAEGLKADLEVEFIPYTPQELIAIAEKEYAWCEAEMKKAAQQMGFSDWRAALEKVKNLYVEPGKQTQVIRDLAFEAIEYVESRKLLTVPALAKEIWRMEMLSPERQKVSPFFLGGEVIQVSYPTDAMEHDDKMMSMRGNNPHFSRATVHHELIPGHHLQGFMTSRFNQHRQEFSTPFWGEGWALYWEMVLWDMGFAQKPEDKVGMLFWRMHRAARIMFSLGVHLGTMTPNEAVELLVNKVGHERANAEAEVRRSFIGTYPPVYQAAYMLGALQFRALRKELVESGKMREMEFHDRILQGGRMPIEMVRAMLLKQPLPKDFRTQWRFYGNPIIQSDDR
ncbi:MAG TPA: DUF885 family protein [Gemmatimonadaceae bacterium]|nr:DUF885 family protein [Gemmatimonadaceae bacterium]